MRSLFGFDPVVGLYAAILPVRLPIQSERSAQFRVCVVATHPRPFDALLDDHCRTKLDALLLPREGLRTVVITWLQQPPGEPKAKNVLAHLDRLHRIREVNLPAELGQAVHQGRLTQLAHEGAQMSAQHLRELESRRRYATLIAVLFDTEATITDQVFDMHDRIVGRMFNDAKRKHELGFAESGKAINEKKFSACICRGKRLESRLQAKN
jgi:hypothetical protein